MPSMDKGKSVAATTELPKPDKPTFNLPAELIIMVVEEIGWDLITIRNLMLTSKTTAALLLAHETSLSTHFASNLHHSNTALLTSAPTPQNLYSHPANPSSPPTYLNNLYRNLAVVPALAARQGLEIPGPSSSTTSSNSTSLPIPIVRTSTPIIPSHFITTLTHPPLPSPPHSLKPAKIVLPGHFAWVSELHLRLSMRETLSRSRLFDLRRREVEAIFEVGIHVCYAGHRGAWEVWKGRGVDMLGGLWDARISPSTPSTSLSSSSSTARCNKRSCKAPKECEARNNIDTWIARQDVETLAAILQLVWIASQLYTYPSHSNGRGHCEHGRAGHGPSAPAATRSMAERSREWERAEQECIFRELALEGGPWFLWCARGLDTGDAGWVGRGLERGVVRLHAYESGATLSEDMGVGMRGGGEEGGEGERLSIQATMLRRLCEVTGVTLRSAWDEVFSINAGVVRRLHVEMRRERWAEWRRRGVEIWMMQAEVERALEEEEEGDGGGEDGEMVWE